jgi:flagellar protein FlaF
MLQQPYLDTAEDSRSVTRTREQEALLATIRAMEEAERNPSDAARRADAVFQVNRLWSMMLEDLASPGNSLPDELRAQLISIGIFVVRQCERIRTNNAAGFAGIIEISRSIERGLD